MRSSLLLAALLLLAGGLRGQTPLRLDPGARVRVVAPSRDPARETGTVERVGRDSLVLARRDGERVAIPYPQIDTIQVSLGPDRRRGAWRGAGLGGVVGLGVGVIAGALGARDVSLGITEAALLGGVGGGVLGAGVGGGAGFLLARDRWQPYVLVHPAARPRRFRP